MRNILINQMEKIVDLAKKVAQESPNTISAFLYYEPKSSQIKNQKNILVEINNE